MKQAIIGLRKRETYEELINDLNHDLITNYPDRRASELENSPYLSQLRGGFEEMMTHNDNLMKEKMKEMLLHEEAGKADVGRHEIALSQNRWRPHIPPADDDKETYVMTGNDATPEQEPLRVPVGQPRSFNPNYPDIEMSESRVSRTAKNRNQPLTPGPEHYNIGSPLNSGKAKRRGRPKKNNLAHDVDADVEEAHAIAIDDADMMQQRQDELREKSKLMARSMLNASHNKAVDNLMPERNDKRREEGADPKPAKPKARQNKPKREAEGPPEEQQEPRGPPGRPKSIQAPEIPKQETPETSPIGPAARKAKEAAAKTKPQEPKSKNIPVKKQAHETEMQHFAPSVWKQKNKAFLIDQYNKRKMGYITGKEASTKISKNELIEKIVEYDKKHSK